MIYGYARVSHKDQNLARQIEQLREFVTDERNIITDKASGKDFDRKGYNSLVGTEESAPMLRSGEQTAVETMKKCGVTKTLFYRKVREMGV